MDAFIAPPTRPAAWLRLGVRAAERQMGGHTLLTARLLAWYPKAALSSAALEALVAHRVRGGGADIDERMLKLVRVATSYAVACHFCIDLNTFEHDQAGVPAEVVRGVADQSLDPHQIPGLTAREALAVEYARLMSATPAVLDVGFVGRLTGAFTDREIVVLATTVAQVNYWARLNAGLGVPPVGFRDACAVPARRD